MVTNHILEKYMSLKPIVLSTGSTKGIGLETLYQLGKQGFTVIISGRNESQGAVALNKLQHAGLDAHFIFCDVCDESSIQQAAKAIHQRFGHLDVLINNAGINLEAMRGITPHELLLDEFRQIYEPNVFGVFAVTKYMIPLLKHSTSGRVINVSSSLGSFGVLNDSSHPFSEFNLVAYNSSKAALNALTVSFAKVYASDNISVNSVCPGWVKTDMGGPDALKEVSEGASIIVKLATMHNPPTGTFMDDSGVVPW
jgi:NAD(P)-dependent dehydrogenase (short-subunit alcohol dehydrogenase family)